jgi:hypothetical protein
MLGLRRNYTRFRTLYFAPIVLLHLAVCFMVKLRQHFRAHFYAWLIWFGIILFVQFCSLLLFSYKWRYKPIFIGFSRYICLPWYFIFRFLQGCIFFSVGLFLLSCGFLPSFSRELAHRSMGMLPVYSADLFVCGFEAHQYYSYLYVGPRTV